MRGLNLVVWEPRKGPDPEECWAPGTVAVQAVAGWLTISCALPSWICTVLDLSLHANGMIKAKAHDLGRASPINTSS